MKKRAFACVATLALLGCATGTTDIEGGGETPDTGCEPGSTRACYSGPEGTLGLGLCVGGLQTCLENGKDYGPCEGDVVPRTEDCSNSIDEDCDGNINDADAGCVCTPGTATPCYTGPEGTEGIGRCIGGSRPCNNDGTAFGSCEGEATPILENCATPEDDDCDGQSDDPEDGCVCTPGVSVPCYSGPAGTEGIGNCVGGTATCDANGTSLGPCVGEVVPSTEVCATDTDDDCDGLVNEDGPDCICTPGEVVSCYTGANGTLGIGLCAGGTWTCNAQGTGFGLCLGQVVPAAETCNTPGDDDCDGQTNEQGAGCVCLPNSSTTCYTGPVGTLGLGVCVSGIKTCDSQGKTYGPCVGEVVPTTENCANLIDDDCDGVSCATPTFAYSLGDASDQVGKAVAVDSTDNAFVTGSFVGTLALGGNTLVNPSASDVFLAKVSPAGAFTWSKSFGDSAVQTAHGIATDPQNNVIIVGGYSGTMDFGGGAQVSLGSTDVFAAKFNSSGTYLFGRRFGDAAAQFATGVDTDSVGSAYIVGSNSGTISYAGGSITSAGSTDVFVIKIGALGSFVWAKDFGDSSAQAGTGIVVNNAGSIVLVGTFAGTIDFGGGPLTSMGGTDIFVAKLDVAGNHVMSLRFGDSADQTVSDVTVDDADNILFAGAYQGSVDFGAGTLSASSGQDIYVVKLTTAGVPVWSKGFPGLGDQVAKDIAVDAGGNVVLTGSFTGSVDFGLGALAATTQNDAFLAKFTSMGAIVWAKGFGNGGDQSGLGVATDSLARVLFTGYATGLVDVGTGPLGGAGGTDFLLAQFAP